MRFLLAASLVLVLSAVGRVVPPPSRPCADPVAAAPVAEAAAPPPHARPQPAVLRDPCPGSADAPSLVAHDTLSGADTAWMMTSTALVLLMTLPGIALFYAGMVRRKSVLNTMASVVAIAALVSLLWFAAGYSLAFTPGSSWLGDGSRMWFSGLDYVKGAGKVMVSHVAPNIPESVYALYQLTFAIITAAWLWAFVERMKFRRCCGCRDVDAGGLCPSRTGCGSRADGWPTRRASICRRLPWCISTPAWPAVCGTSSARRRELWPGGVRAYTWAGPWPAPGCCGWAGSASMPARP